MLMKLAIVGVGLIIVALVVELLDDALDVILCVIIAIAVAGGIGYGLYVEVFHPAYLSCRKFINEHPHILKTILLAALALVLLIIFLCVLGYICRLLTPDYTRLIHNCNRDIARATEALEQAKVAEENHRRCNEFEILEPGRHRYGYNPNKFEREVDRCTDTLNCLKAKKQYYEKQRRKADKLRHR